MNRLMLFSLMLLFVLGSCSKDDDDSLPADSIQYEVIFNATWSQNTHPTDFPPNPHFSGLIGMTHNSTASLFKIGELASPGMKNMAETGGKSPLDAEINDMIDSQAAQYLISGGGANSPGSSSVKFAIDTLHSVVSIVTMIAPSPDWFVAVTIDLFEGDTWLDNVVVPVTAYDAGTDSGPNYTSPDSAEDPAKGIYLITDPPLGNGNVVQQMGTMTFNRIN